MDSRLWALACALLTGTSLLQLVAGGYHSDGGLMNATMAPTPATTSQARTGKEVSYLFVQMANSATLRFKTPGNMSDGATLTLVGVPAQTVWFTSIPFHKAGRLSTSKLSALNAFWEEAPNAALVGNMPGQNKSTSMVVMLQDAVYNPATQRMTFSVQVLDSEGENSTFASTSFASKPHTYHLMDGEMGTALMLFDDNHSELQLQDVSLFIDNFCYQGLFFGGCWDGNGNNAWGVGIGPWRFGGSNNNNNNNGGGGGCGNNCGGGGGGGCPNCGCPNCGAEPRGCWDQWGTWHWENEPYGYCDWERNMWFYYPSQG